MRAPPPEVLASARLLDFARYLWPGFKTGNHHRLIAARLHDVERGKIKRLAICMPPRHGKALAVDTPIATPRGWTTMGKLRPGDRVFDETGRPCSVVAVSPVWKDRDVYEVTPDDGDPVVADGAHEWVVRLDHKRPVFKIKTTDYLARRTSPRRPMVARQGALDLPAADLPVEPYALGAWLGNGDTRGNGIHDDAADLSFIRAQFDAAGYQTTTRSTPDSFGVLGLADGLKRLGVFGNKHIPVACLRASAQQRLALLQGLVDSDGHVAPDGQVEFCSTVLALAEGVQELVRSLGRKASLIHGRAMLNGVDHGPKWRVMFYMAGAARLPRHAARCRDATKTPHRYIDVRPAGRADTVCIEVDSPSHMFLAGRAMLPTHNSKLASVFLPAWWLGRRPADKIICASSSKNFARKWGRETRNLLADPRFQRVFPGVALAGDSKAAESFQVRRAGSRDEPGEYNGLGVSGGSGLGSNLFILDDPVKDAEAADSEARKEAFRDWYSSVVETRLMPGGAVVVVQTRWREDDPVGWLQREYPDDGWHLLSLSALAERDETWPMADGTSWVRRAGEALWPEQWSRESMEAKRDSYLKSSRGRDWYSLYQQDPEPKDSAVDKEKFGRYDAPPKELLATARRVVISLDTAQKDGAANDLSAATVWAEREDGHYLLLSAPERKTAPDLRRWVVELNATWRPHAVLIEDKASGIGLIQDLRAPCAGLRCWCGSDGSWRHNTIPVVAVNPGNLSKVLRWLQVTPMIDAGQVWLPSRAPWLAAYEQEVRRFPKGEHDDQVDSTSQYLNWVRGQVQADVTGAYSRDADRFDPLAKAWSPGW